MNNPGPRLRHGAKPGGSGARGFGLFAAIAILVILAALGAFIVSVTGLRDQSAGLDILGTRAFLAARAGVEWNMFLIQNPEDPANNPVGGPHSTQFNCTTSLPAPVNLAAGTFGGVLSSFTVTVSCATTQSTEAGNNVWVHQIVATACNDPAAGACPNNASGNPSYAERKITALTGTCRTPSNDSC